MIPSEPHRTIKVRAPRFNFDHVSRHWFGGNVLASHVVNGINLLFPAGERFFVRSVHHYAGRIRDPKLREQVRAFSGQEGRHAKAHETYFEVLEAQGYRIRGFLKVYDLITYELVERLLSPELRLSTTVAAEHFTATMAQLVFAGDSLASADPSMRELLLWHAAEEIEHKSVAFDVLKEVNSGYFLRMAGLAIAGTLLTGFWVSATVMLIRQDGAGLRRLKRDLSRMRRRRPSDKRGDRNVPHSYFRRDFHPDQEQRDTDRAREYLESAGIA
jgi:predicted metal-dependent hydrolase